MAEVPLNTQELALALLSKLVVLPYCREVVIGKGGIPLIVSLLQHHPDASALVFCGLSCIGYLSHGSACIRCVLCVDYHVCSTLSELNAFPLMISLCVNYVQRMDRGIVMQVLGIVSNILCASKEKTKNGGVSARFFSDIDELVITLLANELVQLLDKLLVIFQKDKGIAYQCVTSLAVLSYTAEGLTYLKNTTDLIEHLQSTLTTRTNLPQTVELATIILKRLGCAIT